jgi:hypothetical protein
VLIEISVALPGDNSFWGTSLFVVRDLWYAIWIWCGGGIRAAGWGTVLGMNVGSDAASELDVRVRRSRFISRRWPRFNQTADPAPARRVV